MALLDSGIYDGDLPNLRGTKKQGSLYTSIVKGGEINLYACVDGHAGESLPKVCDGHHVLMWRNADTGEVYGRGPCGRMSVDFIQV